jgi:hypothetical protein
MSDEELTPAVVIADILASEADVRSLQQAIGRGVERRLKETGRTDLMPGRHYAIALTALEEARLRVQEAARLTARIREAAEADERR